MLKLDDSSVNTPPPQSFSQPSILIVDDTLVDRRRALGCLSVRTEQYHLDNDPSLISPLVTLLRDEMLAIGICDENGAMKAGIALEEALLNALYHGNLEINSDLKQDDDRAFHTLAAERRGLFPYNARRIRVSVRFTPDEAEFVIADEGLGFDTSSLPDPNDPQVLLRPCGRGLMLINMFMDEVTYNGTGDTVTMVKRRSGS
jgi:anti-sigma regulatory factor (Ser/Thr protein kinase)